MGKTDFVIVVATKIGRKDRDGLSTWKVTSRIDGLTMEEAEAAARDINARMTAPNRADACPLGDAVGVGGTYWSRY